MIPGIGTSLLISSSSLRPYQFMTVGYKGTIAGSNDGIHWTNVFSHSNSSILIRDIATDNVNIVAVYNNIVSNTVTPHVLYSSDSLNWTDVALSAITADNPRVVDLRIAYGNGIWVAVREGTASTNTAVGIYSSNNGTTWTSRTYNGSANNDLVWELVYANGYFVVSGYNANQTLQTISYSVDGITWTGSSANVYSGVFDLPYVQGGSISHANGVWYYWPTLIASDGSSSALWAAYTSDITTPLQSWTNIVHPSNVVTTGYGLGDVSYGQGSFIIPNPQLVANSPLIFRTSTPVNTASYTSVFPGNTSTYISANIDQQGWTSMYNANLNVFATTLPTNTTNGSTIYISSNGSSWTEASSMGFSPYRIMR